LSPKIQSLVDEPDQNGDHKWQTKESVTETTFKVGNLTSNNRVHDKESKGNAIKALAGQKKSETSTLVYETTTVEEIGGVVSETNTKKTTTGNVVVGGEKEPQREQHPQRDLKGDLLQQATALNSGLGTLRQTL